MPRPTVLSTTFIGLILLPLRRVKLLNLFIETNAAFSLVPLQLYKALCFFTQAKLKAQKQRNTVILFSVPKIFFF